MQLKRALVVDDSKSARSFLTHVLEQYQLAVDGVESAEQAIEYLAQQRPDVIFMDHLMPGMDGFQAVQVIKSNPRTATIPIMMYTSQEGELYLSQARALGAVGVLPKQTMHADLGKALEQLKLCAPARAEPTIASLDSPADTPAVAEHSGSAERRGTSRPRSPALPPQLRAIMEAMLQHHEADMRRFIVESLENQSDRIVGDVRLMIQDNVAAARSAAARPSVNRFAAVALAALVAAIVLALQWGREHERAAALAASLAASKQQLTAAQHQVQSLQTKAAAARTLAANEARAARAAAAVPAVAAAAAASPAAGAAPAASAAATGPTASAASAAGDSALVDPVPFGQMPLAGTRVQHIQALLARLTAAGFHGTVDIQSIPGRFCLIIGPTGTAALAPDASLYSQCDQIAEDPAGDGPVSELQSVGFANMLAAARQSAAGQFNIQVSAGSPDQTSIVYPAVTSALTAGQWNRAALANNRVEVHWQAAK